MSIARISDIFLSYQGEGPYGGVKQLFIRFYGCSFNCDYCDTNLSSYENIAEEELEKRISEYKETYHSLSLTGGEPLEQVEFLEGFLPLYRINSKKIVYLETNGIYFSNFEKIKDCVDIVAMDFKLPSSTGKGACWDEHKKFLEIARYKDVFVKIVITENTVIDDVIITKNIIKNIDYKIPIILQPVDPVRGIGEPSVDMLTDFRIELEKELIAVKTIPQYHKILGIK